FYRIFAGFPRFQPCITSIESLESCVAINLAILLLSGEDGRGVCVHSESSHHRRVFMRRTAFWFVIVLMALASGLVSAQSGGAEILVNRDGVNVRLYPAIGAEVLGFVQAGWRAPATGRSPDNQWI